MRRAEKYNDSGGFTLIELLVAITIISMLIGMLLPALNRARASSRQAACSSNLRQFGIGMFAYAERHAGFLCSGSFDWKNDGCVTEAGWVADLVKAGTPVGKMLCPGSSCQISRTFEDLLNLPVSASDECLDRLGSAATKEIDGSTSKNPCREIIESNLAPGSEERRSIVEKKIFNKHFNTNYTASWWLVRSGVRLDSNGNLKSDKASCGASLLSRHSTLGPLTQARADTSAVSNSFIPLLGCGAAGKPLSSTIGSVDAGTPTAQNVTAGPVKNPEMTALSFTSGSSTGWNIAWKAALQDYRNFGPVHRGSCNILFADGGVRAIYDKNGDGQLNNGFSPTADNGFTSDDIEMSEDDFLSKWSLR